jgi:hypothetical protein
MPPAPQGTRKVMGLLGYFSAAHDNPPKAQADAKINKAQINLFIGNLLEMSAEND